MLALVDPYILAFSAITVVVTVFMGFWAARKSKSAADFFVAGRGVSVGWNASAISGEYLSAASFMGVAGMVMSSGYDALWYPVCYACGYLFLLLFIAGPLRRFGAYTIPDFAEGRYDSPVFRKIAVIFVLFIGFFYTMPQMKGAGTTLAYIFKDIDFMGHKGLPYWVGVVLVGAVITLNVALGGMKGITLVQAFQYWAKMFAISVPVFVLMSVYGSYGKQLGLNGHSATGSATAGPATAATTSTSAPPVVAALVKPSVTMRDIPLPADNGGPSMVLQNVPADTVLNLYESAVKRTLLPRSAPTLEKPDQTLDGTIAQFALQDRSKFSNTLITASGDTNSYAALKQSMEKGLAENGVTLVPVGDDYFCAIETKKLDAYFAALDLKPASSTQPPPAAQMVRDRNVSSSSAAIHLPVTAHRTMADIAFPADDGEGSIELNGFPVDKALEAYERLAKRTLLPRRIKTLETLDRMLEGQLTRVGILEQAKFRGAQINVAKTEGSTAKWKQPLEKGFADAGITLVPVGDEYFRAIETPKLAAYFAALDREAGPGSGRQPLTAKAPKDETWLNPFGPLTTKAAKAAKGAVHYGGEFLPPSTFRYTTDLSVKAHYWWNLWTSPHGDGLAGREPHQNDSVFEIINEYWMAAEKSSGARIPVNSELWIAKALRQPEWQKLKNVPSTAGATHEEARKLLKKALEENGITVVQDPVNVFKAFPTKDAIITPIDAKPYALLYTYSLIIALVCGTAGLPHILVRFYTNPDGVSAKRTTMWVMILIGIFYVFPPVFGALGRNLMPSLYEGAGVGGTDGLVLKLPTILNDRFGVLGSVLSGITCAGAFAAFMSTFSGLLVSMTGALAHDVYGRILRPKSTAAERMQMFKWCAVAIGIVAVLLGTLVENFEINFMVGQAFAIAAASYFPLLFMSVWWRGMTTRGAATGMLTGGLCAVAAISVASWTTFFTAQAAKFKSLGVPEPGWFAALKPYALTDFWGAHPLLRILSEQPAIWAVPLAITLMIVVSKLTAREVPADIRMKMLVLHAPEALGLKQEYIREHDGAH